MMRGTGTNGGQIGDNRKCICPLQKGGQMDGGYMYTPHLSPLDMSEFLDFKNWRKR
jgi:hypothetical protein